MDLRWFDLIEEAWDKTQNRMPSPCCSAKIEIVYKRVTTERISYVFACLRCEKLHVASNKD